MDRANIRPEAAASADPNPGFPVPNGDPGQSSAPKKPVAKKRTKTGCYTCRRRRIKCDEGKPYCNNCIKSKRQCEGYIQRVTFKDPLGTYPRGHLPLSFHGHPGHLIGGAQIPGIPPHHVIRAAAAHGSLPFIAPRPPLLPEGSVHLPQHLAQPYPQHPLSLPMQSIPQQLPSPPYQMPNEPSPPQVQVQLSPNSRHPLDPNAVPFTPLACQPNLQTLSPPVVPSWQQQQHQQQQQQQQQQQYILHPTQSQQPISADQSVPYEYEYVPLTAQPSASTSTASPTPAQDTAAHDAAWQQGTASGHLPYEEPHGLTMYTEEDVYWFPDDDASMADSEDEEAAEEAAHWRSVKPGELGALVAKRLPHSSLNTFDSPLNTFASFADAHVLSNYFPSSVNSPLTNSQTAAVFSYFVNVTGPSISLCERHPSESTSVFDGMPIPRSRQQLWTYTFPIIALNHPALLQAMLALGSLHIAKLQGVPATASMKHYHLSLRRVARNYQSPSRRVQPATLAATMLLGFYEVWNSDHDKWCKHMWGARAILREIPLCDMTRKMIAIKHRERARLRQTGSPLLENAFLLERDIDQVDPDLLYRLSGQVVSYTKQKDTYEHALNAHAPSYSSRPGISWTTPDHYTEKDAETYMIFCDLYWWYCKMDVYQSILGGTRLLMEYKFWTQCAPRAPIGKADAVYGTYDHLMLLLGRLCDFASRDQSRKRKAKRPDGGPPGGPPGQSPPPFVGMMPSTGNITIPNGFSPPREETPESDTQEEMDFDARTAAAMVEWENIKNTLEVFRGYLGSDFDPLGPEYEPPVASPFGPVLKYRTYEVASVWMNYYMALIVLYRCHPTMPHIAMAAAAMSARQTAPYANEIGRIVAGLTSDDLSAMASVSTQLGAVSIECSFPLFVAAVQYQDINQRHWTVRRLHNVARLTGWQSARQIANGCETGWSKAASMGRGQPYEPPTDLAEVPEAIWNRPRRMADRIRELDEENAKLVLSSTERSHYAIGLLSMEADLEKLELSDRE